MKMYRRLSLIICLFDKCFSFYFILISKEIYLVRKCNSDINNRLSRYMKNICSSDFYLAYFRPNNMYM